jgi:hypothetical protein
MAEVTRAAFQAAFLAELRDFAQDEKERVLDVNVHALLKDKKCRELAAALAWQYVTTPQLIQTSHEYVKLRQSLLKEAVTGIEAAIRFFTLVDDQPGIRADLRKALNVLRYTKPSLALPTKLLGRDRDWTAVREIKEQLKIKDDAVAVVVNAADKAFHSGRRPVDAENIAKSLLRLKKRLPLAS